MEKESLNLPSLKPRTPSDRDFTYKVPGTDTTLELIVSLDIPLNLAGIREALSSALFEVNSILDVAGDGPVPLQDYDKEASLSGSMVSVGVFSGDVSPEILTYGILKDVLTGLWDHMVTNRWRFRTYAIAMRRGVGVVAHALVLQRYHEGKVKDS